MLLDHHQSLDEKRTADGNDHPAAAGKLLDQRRGNVAGGGGDDNSVEGGVFAPPLVPIALSHGDVVEAETPQPFVGRLRQCGDDLDGVDTFGERAEYGRLIA